MKCQIALLEDTRQEYMSMATSITQNITGMPRSSSSSDKTSLAAEIADTEIEIQNKKISAASEYTRLTRYIIDISDPLIRSIFICRFVRGMSWMSVAEHVGGGNTEYSVKQACYRYLKEKQKN